MKFYIVTFQNTHEAINGENVAKKNNINVTVIPTPTYITKSCGISLKIKEENFQDINKLIEQGKIHIKNIYLKEKDNFQKIK